MRRVVQTRETGGRAAPFCNRGVQERLPAKFGDCGGELLGRGGCLEDDPHLFGELFTGRLQGTHYSVTPIDMETDVIVVFRNPVSPEPVDELLKVPPHLPEPLVAMSV